MTWLSRLLTQSPSLRTTRERTRRSMSQRRRAALECLENRSLLSNVSINYVPGPVLNQLNITADVNNNAFKIQELADGTVQVNALTYSTTLNSIAYNVPYVTPGAVNQINITLPGNGNANVDKVVLTGLGKSTVTTVKDVNINVTGAYTNLALSVANVDNAGALNVYGPFAGGTMTGVLTGPGTTAAQLANPTYTTGPATIDNSTFGSLNIRQSGRCAASVELGSDSIPGTVAVSLGDHDSDAITLQALPGLPGDAFGSTTLTEGNGGSDSVQVLNAQVRDLTVSQGYGGSDVIKVDTVGLATPYGKGVSTSQGNGGNDTTTVNKVTLAVATPTNYQPLPLAGISVSQGSGTSDQAQVTNSVVPGSIKVTQTGGDNDIAQVLNSTAGSTLTATSPASDISVSQGKGAGDQAWVSNSAASGNISVTQTDGNKDVINILGSTAGSKVWNGDYYNEYGGTVTVSQGNGYNDTVVLNSLVVNGVKVNNSFNNVNISQGLSIAPSDLPPCTPLLGDEVHVNDTSITSNLIITQGTSAAAGNYVVTIGDTGPVTAGYWTWIQQHGSNNTVQLGGASGAPSETPDFLTNYLDVVTGFAGDTFRGGAFVTAMNTQVGVGSLLNPYVITGSLTDSTSNVYVDMGGNSKIYADPATYVTFATY